MKAEIAGIFGPVSDTSRGYVQSLAQTFLIPHINAVWDSRTEREYFSVNVYPDHEVLSGAYADLIKYFGWKDFTVIYDDNDSKCTGFFTQPKLDYNGSMSGGVTSIFYTTNYNCPCLHWVRKRVQDN